MTWQKINDNEYAYNDVKNPENDILITIIRNFNHQWSVSVKGVNANMGVPFNSRVLANRFVKTFIKKHRRGVKRK